MTLFEISKDPSTALGTELLPWSRKVTIFAFSLSLFLLQSLAASVCVCECVFRAAGVVRRMLSLTFEASDRASKRRGETDPDTDSRDLRGRRSRPWLRKGKITYSCVMCAGVAGGQSYSLSDGWSPQRIRCQVQLRIFARIFDSVSTFCMRTKMREISSTSWKAMRLRGVSEQI